MNDEQLLRSWTEFKKSYVDLGYRAASYEYFCHWLRKTKLESRIGDAESIQRRLHAYRKRLRAANPSRGID